MQHVQVTTSTALAAQSVERSVRKLLRREQTGTGMVPVSMFDSV